MIKYRVDYGEGLYRKIDTMRPLDRDDCFVVAWHCPECSYVVSTEKHRGAYGEVFVHLLNGHKPPVRTPNLICEFKIGYRILFWQKWQKNTLFQCDKCYLLRGTKADLTNHECRS